jgi:cytochrome b pre-mRNA-processing protein 3
MILKRIFARVPDAEERLYGEIVAAARRPKFYADWAVPDTVDGRFDMIVLHLFLVLERLKGQGEEDLRQRLIDTFFKDMDRSLREMGVGDLSVAKKVRKMAEAFYGRVTAYAAALQAPATLPEVLRRNIFPETPEQDVTELANWLQQAAKALAQQPAAAVAKGDVEFP